MLTLTDEGIRLIRHFEGCRLTAYHDPVGILTIGYGHTGADVRQGMTITQDQADALLGEDLMKFAQGVRRVVPSTINHAQFSACVSLAYNVGLGAFEVSTLLKRIGANEYWDAANEFTRWNKAGGKVLPGLLRRRWAERDLFCGFPARWG
jgi:lysozyme